MVHLHILIDSASDVDLVCESAGRLLKYVTGSEHCILLCCATLCSLVPDSDQVICTRPGSPALCFVRQQIVTTVRRSLYEGRTFMHGVASVDYCPSKCVLLFYYHGRGAV
jgi:hypothetical protein